MADTSRADANGGAGGGAAAAEQLDRLKEKLAQVNQAQRDQLQRQASTRSDISPTAAVVPPAAKKFGAQSLAARRAFDAGEISPLATGGRGSLPGSPLAERGDPFAAAKRVGGRQVVPQRSIGEVGNGRLLPQAPAIAPPMQTASLPSNGSSMNDPKLAPGSAHSTLSFHGHQFGLHLPHHSIFNRTASKTSIDASQAPPSPSLSQHEPAADSNIVPFLFQDYSDIAKYGEAPVHTQPSPSTELPDPFSAMYGGGMINESRRPSPLSPFGGRQPELNVVREVSPERPKLTRVASDRRDASVAMMPVPTNTQSAAATNAPAPRNRGFFSSFMKRKKNESSDGKQERVPTVARVSTMSPPPQQQQQQQQNGVTAATQTASASPPKSQGQVRLQTAGSRMTFHSPFEGSAVSDDGTSAKTEIAGQPMGVPGLPPGPNTRISPGPKASISGIRLPIPGNLRRAGTARGSIPLLRGKRSTVSPTSSVAQGASRQGSSFNGPAAAERHSEEIVLDTDFSQMHDILAVDANATIERESLPSATFSFGTTREPSEAITADGMDPAWAPPESWAVRKVEENVRTADAMLADTDPLEEAQPEALAVVPARKESTHSIAPVDAAALALKRGAIHQMRIYRGDWTFATVACGMNITTEGLMALLGRKFFLPSVANYQILIQRNGLSRVLMSWERPFHIQKTLLEQAGYQAEDRLEELGREDNSYLCRFIFTTISLQDYSDFDRGELDAEHFDLSGRNVQTIPVMLYKYASKIKSLDLSRNLSLDIPIDFIQSCPNLESIVMTHSELAKLQVNVVEAKSLVFLDASFNRLTELHDNLSELGNLVSLIVRNNSLSKLPSCLSGMTSLRRVNMSSNLFDTFPKELCELYNLEDLDVSFNRITKIPDDIGKLNRLQRLLINNNRLRGTLPRQFTELQSLREIDVRFNRLMTLDILTQLPLLESISAGHNAITVVEANFPNARLIHLDKCPVTKFSLLTQNSTLTSLDLSMAKLPSIADEMFDSLINLVKLVLDDNHFTYLPPQIGKLTKLQHLSCKNNQLTTLPDEIGQLVELRVLDVHSNNIKNLPASVWSIHGLVSLNASSNLLTAFPEPPSTVARVPESRAPSIPGTPGVEMPEVDLSASLQSIANRKGSLPSITARSTNTMAQTLRYLYLGDNRLDDACFEPISLLQELRVLNLAFNDVFEIPDGALRRLAHLIELYLSGNELTSLPADDLEEMQSLRVLHLNANKLQSLPAEIGKIRRLLVLDVGSNALKYNTNNWPYDWNWNWNLDLKYLNLSGNKRLEIKPSNNQTVRDRNLSEFTALTKLRVLGLMDITLTIDSLPEETHDRRVRLSGTDISNMSYGQADTLGKHDHLSTIDMVVPRFQGREDETIFAMFDGSEVVNTGSKVARHLQDFFAEHLAIELKRLRATEDVTFALRRAFLTFNKELGIQVTPSPVKKDSTANLNLAQRPSVVSQLTATPSASHVLGPADRKDGAAVCLVYLVGKRVYVANTGDAVAVLSKADGSARLLSVKHNAGDSAEIERIREAGGYVSRDGLVNDQLDVTRSIGYFHLAPMVQAAPHVAVVDLTEEDEFIILASENLWEVMSLQTAVDIARSEHEDLMLAAQKLRDFAISYGAQGKISIMVLGVGDLFHRKSKLARVRNASAARGAGGFMPVDEDTALGSTHKSRRRVADTSGVADSTLARLQREVPPPVGEVAMIFTDIKNSTLLWESHPVAMQASIKIHNGIMRRQLRAIGGYEVKTEGDAFMVCFPTTLSALLWCFTVQTQLLTADWPQEILDSADGREIRDEEQTATTIYRGISVRMGVHWGSPVCEVDPITKRMDYFGPMVNRAARISSCADGGQITVSADVVRDVEVLEQIHQRESSDDGRASSDMGLDDATINTIRKEMQMLKRVGFGIAPLGERRLKGLENAEFISLAYPTALKGRITYAEKQLLLQGKKTGSAGAGVLDYRHIVDVYGVVFRLENLCSLVRGNRTRSTNHASTMRQKVAQSYTADDDDDKLGIVLENLLTRVENALQALSLHYAAQTQSSLTKLSGLPMEEILQALDMYQSQKQQMQIHQQQAHQSLMQQQQQQQQMSQQQMSQQMAGVPQRVASPGALSLRNRASGTLNASQPSIAQVAAGSSSNGEAVQQRRVATSVFDDPTIANIGVLGNGGGAGGADEYQYSMYE